MDARGKSWVFTVNNYTDLDISILDNLEVSYIIYGKEVGESGTPHLQGFVTFKSTLRFNSVKKLLKNAHWEKAISSEAMNYCMKDGNFKVRDNRKQGVRNDLKEAISSLKNDGFDKMIIEYPEVYVKYHNGLEKLNIKLKEVKRNFKPLVIWIYGPTGTGKTRQVVEKEKDLWISGKNLRWWDGYDNNKTVLFDDFRKDFCTFHELLRILDRYPYRIEKKGSSMEFNSEKIYITSCFSPEEVYDTREDIGQLIRRIDSIIGPGPEVEYSNT
nr:MAG: replication associated protein [Cressdnaviricota sp.]